MFNTEGVQAILYFGLLIASVPLLGRHMANVYCGQMGWQIGRASCRERV